MEFAMSLLKPTYKNKNILKWNEEDILESLEELKDNRCFFEDVGLWQKGDFFKTRTHLRVKDKDRFCIPVFRLDLFEGENIKDFAVFYNITDQREKMIKLASWPGGKHGSIKSWYFAEEKKPAVGAVQPGYVDIIIKETGRKDVIKKIWICPSSLTDNHFSQMLKDISHIPYKVLHIKRNEAKSYVGSDWECELESIQYKIEKLNQWLLKIENSPRGNLKNCKQLAPYSKIKKFNSSVLQQYMRNHSKRKYLIDSPEHSIDIYEHRVFCKYLERLKETIIDWTKDYLIKAENYKSENIYKYCRVGEPHWNTSLRITVRKNWRNVLPLRVLQVIDKIRNNRKIKKVIKEVTVKEKDIIGCIDSCFKRSLFKDIKIKDERWRITQILTNDFRYHQVYKILKSLAFMTTIPSVSDWKKIFINKTDKIYEIWILSKIISLIEKQRWCLKNGDNLESDINRIYDKFGLIKAGDKEEWALSGTFEHKDAGLEMELYYNTPIDISLKDLVKIKKVELYNKKDEIQEKENEKNWYFRPDFLFRIRKTNGEEIEKIFILDAKYRNYENQSFDNFEPSVENIEKNKSNECNNFTTTYDTEEAYWLYKDVETVAYEKYIYRIKKEYGVDVTASFIIHTDKEAKDRNKSSLEYTGKFVTYNASVDERWREFLKPSSLREEFLKQEKDESEKKGKKGNSFYKDKEDYEPDKIDASKQQIGAFYMVPEANNTRSNSPEKKSDKKDKSSENLKTFFAMVFEYYMGVTNICWNCGQKYKYDKGKNGYYCPICTHFWKVTHCHNKHLLVKHWDNINNYHIIREVKPIDNKTSTKEKIERKEAKCPICNAGWC